MRVCTPPSTTSCSGEFLIIHRLPARAIRPPRQCTPLESSNSWRVYLEIGAGDCSLAFAVAGKVIHVYAIDVSDEISKQIETPANFESIISDGISISVPAGSIDFAYSNQLMEHLHPDDADSQLENAFTALRPGGAYLCITPKRLLAHPTYRLYFDEPTGFHLKEYTNRELREMLG